MFVAEDMYKLGSQRSAIRELFEYGKQRRSQVGTGDRSEKIRTYNFPQGRVTDHRIKFTSHRLNEILDGDLTELLDNIIAVDQAAKLAKMNEEA